MVVLDYAMQLVELLLGTQVAVVAQWLTEQAKCTEQKAALVVVALVILLLPDT
jgi:hypothetical protein